jgi:hypothetical protein
VTGFLMCEYLIFISEHILTLLRYNIHFFYTHKSLSLLTCMKVSISLLLYLELLYCTLFSDYDFSGGFFLHACLSV